MFAHKHFWRHFAAYTAGGACMLLGTLGAVVFPPLAPVAGKLILTGSGLLGLAGTRVIEPTRHHDERAGDRREDDTQ